MIAERAEKLFGAVRQGLAGRFGSTSAWSGAANESRERWRFEFASDIATMSPNEVEVHEAAVVAAGYHDFGDRAYREGLRVLLEAIDASDYSTAQKSRIRGNLVVRVLRSRLYSERGWGEHPGCLGERIEGPMFVVGLPRTGTTALHKLLAADPNLQGLNGWLVSYPMPRPPRDEWSSRAEYRAVAAAQEAAMASSTMRAAHVRTADEVDEPLELISQSFVSNYFPAICKLPVYDRWFAGQSQLATYERFVNNLRLVGANDPGRRWLLQNPTNILSLDDLLAVFPDAKIIWTHRSPGDAIASLTSLLTAVRRAVLRDEVACDDITGREIALWSRAVNEAMTVRQRHPENFADVQFDDLVADPVGTARRIYKTFDIELKPGGLAAIERWAALHPQGKQGRHEYSRDGSALSPARMRSEFGVYLDAFGLNP